ncbi:MAG: hypothetical protein E7273_10295 [Pseudobutyrivibrio ruminis]|nr:hypothetical protein [Pseudobutyrivibrio ruminis]
MNGTVKKIYEGVALETGLRCDENVGALIGEYRGYNLSVVYKNNYYCVYASVRKNGQLPDKETLKNIKKSIKGVSAVAIEKNNVFANVTGLTSNKVIENLVSTIKGLTEGFKINGYENVCEGCGKPVTNIKSYFVGGGITYLCDDCYTEISQGLQKAEVEMNNTSENVMAGFVGAFFGSLIGLITTIIIGQLGYVAVVSGIVMGVCTIKGYQMMAKKFSAKGIIICSVMMIVITYFAEKLDWVITMVTESNWPFNDAFHYFWEILEASDAVSSFIASLALVYIFTAVGAIPTIINAIKAEKVAYNSYQIQ